MQKKMKKERNHLSTLPMALTKDYNEMRVFYNMNSNGNIIKNRNENKLRNIYSFGIDNKNKIISMLSNNKIGSILGNLDEKKLKELLQ